MIINKLVIIISSFNILSAIIPSHFNLLNSSQLSRFDHNSIRGKIANNAIIDIKSSNDTIYFLIFRFVGGGGTPYAIQNVLPILFNMPLRNYVIATLIGSTPSMFVTVSLGSGIESVIDQNAELSISSVLLSPEIYIPIIGFFVLLIIAFFIKKIYFKNEITN